jgi:hypothetical protein
LQFHSSFLLIAREVLAMLKRSLVPALAVCLVGVLSAHAVNPVKSGPQVGEKVPGPFQPLNITGPYAGKKHCLYCENGMRPAVMIFAREMSPALIQLLRSLDLVAANCGRPMGAYVIFCSDDPAMPALLENAARGWNLSKMIVAAFHADGPQGYQIAPDADVTVLLYNRVTVMANHAFRRGELTEQAARAVVADLPKILTQE